MSRLVLEKSKAVTIQTESKEEREPLFFGDVDGIQDRLRSSSSFLLLLCLLRDDRCDDVVRWFWVSSDGGKRKRWKDTSLSRFALNHRHADRRLTSLLRDRQTTRHMTAAGTNQSRTDMQ